MAKDTGRIFLFNLKSRVLIKAYDPSTDGIVNTHIADFFFLNSDTGFASLNYMWLKKTVDGGQTWFTDTTFNNTPATVGTTKVFSWANGDLYLNSVNFNATNYIHKFNRNTQKWDYETEFKDNNLGFGYENYAGVAGNGSGLFTVFEKNKLAYKTEWNYIKSMKEIAFGNPKIYPNPFKDKLTIDYSTLKDANFEIILMDSYGKIITSFKNKNEELGDEEIFWEPSSNITTGCYFLRFKIEGFPIQHYKILKEK